ncbi:MAG: anion permease [Candidatus Omnitrophica bacterium]|nr:anion permease [Candidatus Omnitrophota bacterium]
MQKLKTPLIFAAIVFGTAFLLSKIGFTRDQVIATSIFLLVICGTLFYWQFRVTFAFAGIAVLLGSKLLDIPHVIEHAGLDIILFLVGMMCVVGHLEEKHFFEYLIAKVVDRIGHHAYLLMAVLMAFATLSAALVDEVTSILFMMAATFHLTKRYKVNPIPFLLMIVFATNVGSSATAVGNPIGVMIALRAQLSFTDFLRWASPISIVTLVVTIPLCFLYFGTEIRHLANQMKKERSEESEVTHVRYRKKDIVTCWVLFLGTITLLVLHHPIEEAMGLEKNTLLLGTSLLAGAVAIFLNAQTARDFFTKRVDWWTLTFFMALFASVGTLKYTGVTQRIAEGMISLAQGNPTFLLIAFTSAVSLLTGFMDNVLAVATFIPILFDIEKSGIYVYPFWWGMLFGGTLYGNLTVIGSTANIVAMGMLEREYKQHIKFMEWLKPGFIVSTITIALALFLIYLQIPLMPR